MGFSIVLESWPIRNERNHSIYLTRDECADVINARSKLAFDRLRENTNENQEKEYRQESVQMMMDDEEIKREIYRFNDFDMGNDPEIDETSN